MGKIFCPFLYWCSSCLFNWSRRFIWYLLVVFSSGFLFRCCLLFRRRLLFALACLRFLFGHEDKRFFERHVFWDGRFRQGGVGAGVLDVGAVFAFADLHGLAAIRVLAKLLQDFAGALFGAGDLFGKNRDRAIEADVEQLFRVFQVRIGAVMQDEGTEAAETGGDLLAGFRVDADFAREREQAQRHVEIDVGRRGLGGQAAALRLVVRFERCALYVRPEASAFQRDLGARLRIGAENAVALGLFAFGADGELARELAIRVVRAADEGAEAADFKREAPVVAGGGLSP